MFKRISASLAIVFATLGVASLGIASIMTNGVEDELALAKEQHLLAYETYLDEQCSAQNAAFEAAFFDDFIGLFAWDTLNGVYSRKVDAYDGERRDFVHYHTAAIREYDAALIGSTALTAASAAYVVEALELMTGFSDDMLAAEYLDTQASVIAAMALKNCLLSADLTPSNFLTDATAGKILTSLAEGDSCVHFDVFVQRYLDEDPTDLSFAERQALSDNIMRAQSAYLEQIDLPDHCGENA